MIGCRHMTQTAEPHYFTERAVQDWTRIATRHRIRDEYFLRAVERYLRRGPFSRIGASDRTPVRNPSASRVRRHGIGCLSPIRCCHPIAWCAANSSTRPRTSGRRRADSCKRSRAGRHSACTVAILPRRTQHWAAIHAALEPQGRLICISPHAWRGSDPQSYFRPREQIEIARASRLYRIIKVFPHQVFRRRFTEVGMRGFSTFSISMLQESQPCASCGSPRRSGETLFENRS